MKNLGNYILVTIVLISSQSCWKAQSKFSGKAIFYKQFRDSVIATEVDTITNQASFFDSSMFIPTHDSLQEMLITIDSFWHKEFALIKASDTSDTWDRTRFFYDNNLYSLKENIMELDSFLMGKNNEKKESCKERSCYLYAEIIKSAQTLYLYLDGELVDSFLVSTGKGKHETPLLNMRPSGPLLRKYTSRKFPGGNYLGLGNMPYAVFISGGYAIHGTTPGNFSQLGHRASHGCIRLHPLNAKIFFELVKLIGLDNTWVRINDSLMPPVISTDN